MSQPGFRAVVCHCVLQLVVVVEAAVCGCRLQCLLVVLGGMCIELANFAVAKDMDSFSCQR